MQIKVVMIEAIIKYKVLFFSLIKKENAPMIIRVVKSRIKAFILINVPMVSHLKRSAFKHALIIKYHSNKLFLLLVFIKFINL